MATTLPIDRLDLEHLSRNLASRCKQKRQKMQPVSHQTAASLLVHFFRSRAPGQGKVKEKCKKRTGIGQQKKRQRKGCHSVAGHQGKPKCKKTQQNFEVETSKSLALFFSKVIQKRKPLEHPKTGPRAPEGTQGQPRRSKEHPERTQGHPKRTQELPKIMCTPGH